MQVTKVTSPEYLSDDMIEEDFLRTFLVLFRLQFIMGSCRLDVKNRFATIPTKAQKCYTIFCIIATAIFDVLLIMFTPTVDDTIVDYLTFSNVILLFLSFLCNVTHVRFFNNDKNVKFFVTMQKIDRLFKIDQWKELNKWVRLFTNIPLATVLLAFTLLMVIGCSERGLVCLYFFGHAFSITTFLLELTACSSIIAYFVLRMKFINGLLVNHLMQKKMNKPKGWLSYDARLRYHSQETKNYYETSDTNIYLRELFRCFTMYQDLYKFQIFIFCAKTVAASLISFELVLYLIIKRNKSSVTVMTTFIVFSVVNLMLAVFLGLRYELFFQEVKETKRLCINIMAKYNEGPLWEKARKMLKMIEETPPRFSVYEMWDMNASTFITMFSLITSLIVTLLQFTLL